MHPEAEKNYRTPIGWGPGRQAFSAKELSEMNDKAVVLTFWGNTAYQNQTGDTHIRHASPELHNAWTRIGQAKSDSDYQQLRKDFEENGWFGSPIA